MNVVSVMAHQDDEMRCLGAMLKCRARGDRLWFITLTDGCNGLVQLPDLPRVEAARIRREEMLDLCRRVGAEYRCLGELDEFLYDTETVRRNLIDALRTTGADLVFTHNTDDYNLDHTTTNSLVRHCAMLASLPVVPTEHPPLARHPAVFRVAPFGPIPFVPTHFVDVTEVEAEKIELLKCHRSQEEAMTRAVKAGFDRLCGDMDAYWGLQVGCAYAEAFAPMLARGSVKPFNVLP